MDCFEIGLHLLQSSAVSDMIFLSFANVVTYNFLSVIVIVGSIAHGNRFSSHIRTRQSAVEITMQATNIEREINGLVVKSTARLKDYNVRDLHPNTNTTQGSFCSK
jgi:hypothetical protein